MVRHLAATLAYRASKVLRGFPQDGAATRASPATRSPLEIVSHLGDLMRWGERMARGERRWEASPAADFERGVEQFFVALAALDAALAERPPDQATAQALVQGPLADALTHVGQLALLRGMAGTPIRPESYARADIAAGQVTREQPPPRAEFDGDASGRQGS